MTVKIITGIAAVALALSTAGAIAQTTPTGATGQHGGTAYNPAIKPPSDQYDMGGAAAKKTTPGAQGVVGQYDMGGAQSLAPNGVQQDKSDHSSYSQGSATAQKTTH